MNSTPHRFLSYLSFLVELHHFPEGKYRWISHEGKAKHGLSAAPSSRVPRPVILLTFFLLLFPIRVLSFDLEAKRPLSASQELRIVQEAKFIKVTGETFTYVFRKDNGLIGAVEVLGRELAGGTPLPDLSLAEQLDPDYSPFAARHETTARVVLETATPARVVIGAEGHYAASTGQRFPLRYSLKYDISIDGVILVDVSNVATGPGTLRWLRLSAGGIRNEAAKFINWMPEQSTSQTTHYQFRALPAGGAGTILSGTWIPWIWIGDEKAGLEITTWDVSTQTYNQLDSTAREDEPAMFVVQQGKREVHWESFLIRRTRIDIDRGWSRSGSFALAVTPSKKIDPYYSLLKGAHLGPHQHVTRLTLPGEPEIRTLAQNGYNLVVGMANWRSGEYIPLNETPLRQTIELCHKYGVKIIPYITLVDLAHSTETFRQFGEQWAIEPTTEFIHHLRQNDWNAEKGYRNDPEEETTLMCPGAEGWRTHWKHQIDRIIRDYDFDGIYFDFWFGRMVCENFRHGCGGRFRRGTVLGSREMLLYAYNRLKAKNPHAIIKANTNTLATALLTSLVDIRLVGEAINAAQMDEDSRRWLHSSWRLGETTEFLWDQTQLTAPQKALFATLVNFLPQWYERPRLEPRSSFDDFDVFRSFEDGTGNWQLGISRDQKLRANSPEIKINTVEKGNALLATVLNPGSSDQTAGIPMREGWVGCEPLTGLWFSPMGGNLQVKLESGQYRHVLLLEAPKVPQVLYALGTRTPARQVYDPEKRKLELTLEAVEGTRVRIGAFAPIPVHSIISRRTGPIPFTKNPDLPFLVFEGIHAMGDLFEIQFQ